ncbi:MAG: glycoside hydrolase family 15 protein [Thermoleophilia bacterium]|nr:glycoside hydrolase family 15 protein [Thermoleophilia bacterium]
MPARIEDYAMLGDTRTAALVSREGSVDWLCVPRFDGGSCFAALLGDPSHGRWLLAPAGGARSSVRAYLDDTMVLRTEHAADGGRVAVTDLMPLDGEGPALIRIVDGLEGRVTMRSELVVRFDYGAVVPWVLRREEGLLLVGGPDALWLRGPVEHEGVGMTSVAEFAVGAGERAAFSLSWAPAHRPPPPDPDAAQALRATLAAWHDWTAAGTFAGEWAPLVRRSLLTLKALTYAPTGGVVAAATTSLPEDVGGVRNWDYRYCWLRDATFTLYALLSAGFVEEAAAWRDWLLRAVAGDPADLQIMYGPGGERRLPEWEVEWLPGYEQSAPVRVGNAAVRQFQLDVYGEVVDAMHQARRVGVAPDPAAWALQKTLLDFLEGAWRDPDEGIWEVRGPRQHFTHSKVLAWVAFDRAIHAVERFGLEGPADRWRARRSEIHAEVCERAWNAERRAFTQHYGSDRLDASVLLMPLVGFLPPRDPRVLGTVEAIGRDLVRDGLVLRYGEGALGGVDGLPGGEGAFLPCSFWLADVLAMQGRTHEARALFSRLVALTNDVGLLSEEYDTTLGRMVGNFPQAFSHVGLVNTAHNLSAPVGPAAHRSARDPGGS